MENGKNCLIIVDVQQGFVNKNTSHIPSKVEKLQADYDNIVATRFHNKENSFYHTLIGWDKFSADSGDIPLAFKPREDALIIDKNIYSCVTNDFLAWLRDRGIRQVSICGIDTDICVTKIAVDLFENGIVPVVLADFCASTAGLAAHENAIQTLRRYIGASQVLQK